MLIWPAGLCHDFAGQRLLMLRCALLYGRNYFFDTTPTVARMVNLI